MPVGTTYQPIAGVHSCLSGHDSELANAPHVADSIPHEYFIFGDILAALRHMDALLVVSRRGEIKTASLRVYSDKHKYHAQIMRYR